MTITRDISLQGRDQLRSIVSPAFIFGALFLNSPGNSRFRRRTQKMTTAKKIVASALAASLALGIAVPASAAVYNPGNLRADIAQLDSQINRAEARRTISRREAQKLDRQVDRLQDTFRAYARGGFTRYELASLNNGIAQVRNQLQAQRWDGNRRADAGRYGPVYRR
jgi:septal ring factor EnvC (AmiA/AmiB activator)